MYKEKTRKKSLSASERGVTLIELLVALVIGLLLIIAASAVYLYSKNSYNNITETSQAEENGRFALNLLTKYVQSAGFVMINPNAVNLQGALVNKVDGCDFGMTNGSGLFSSFGDLACRTSTPAGQMRSASISVYADTDRFTSTGGNFEGFNCIGNRPVSTGIIDESGAVSFIQYQSRAHFYVSQFVSATPNGTVTRGQLSCVAEQNPALGGPITHQAQEPLIPGIEQIAVNYLLPSTVAPKVAQRGRTATAVTNWGDVKAVELCVVARTIQTAGNDSGTSYTDCYGTPITSTSFDTYKIFRTTVNLRNRTPAL